MHPSTGILYLFTSIKANFTTLKRFEAYLTSALFMDHITSKRLMPPPHRNCGNFHLDIRGCDSGRFIFGILVKPPSVQTLTRVPSLHLYPAEDSKPLRLCLKPKHFPDGIRISFQFPSMVSISLRSRCINYVARTTHS